MIVYHVTTASLTRLKRVTIHTDSSCPMSTAVREWTTITRKELGDKAIPFCKCTYCFR
jgi:hypothetical protein